MNNPPCRLNCILPFHKQEQQNFFLFENFKQISNKKKQKNNKKTKFKKFKNSNKTFISLNILNLLGSTSLLRLPTISGFSPCVHVFINASGFFPSFSFCKKRERKKEERKKKSTENTATKKKKMMKMVLGFFGEDRWKNEYVLVSLFGQFYGGGRRSFLWSSLFFPWFFFLPSS